MHIAPLNEKIFLHPECLEILHYTARIQCITATSQHRKSSQIRYDRPTVHRKLWKMEVARLADTFELRTLRSASVRTQVRPDMLHAGVGGLNA